MQENVACGSFKRFEPIRLYAMLFGSFVQLFEATTGNLLRGPQVNLVTGPLETSQRSRYASVSQFVVFQLWQLQLRPCVRFCVCPKPLSTLGCIYLLRFLSASDAFGYFIRYIVVYTRSSPLQLLKNAKSCLSRDELYSTRGCTCVRKTARIAFCRRAVLVAVCLICTRLNTVRCLGL